MKSLIISLISPILLSDPHDLATDPSKQSKKVLKATHKRNRIMYPFTVIKYNIGTIIKKQTTVITFGCTKHIYLESGLETYV